MTDRTELQDLRRNVFELQERCEVLEAALTRAQKQQADRDGLKAVPVGRIPIDDATLMLVDPLYVEASWIRADEADAVAISLGPGEWARALAEPLEKAGHHVEWVNPIQLLVKPRHGAGIEVLRDDALEVIGPAGPVGRVILVRPGATLSRIAGARDLGVVKLREDEIGQPQAAVFRLGGDGHATVVALVDGDGFTKRIEVNVHT